MQEIKKLLFQSAKFTELSSALKGISPASPLNLRGVSGSLLAFVAAFTFEKMKGQLVVVARDEERAEMLRDDCGLLAGEANVRFFGKRPHHTGQSLDLTSSVAQIETLQSLAASSRLIIVASPSSVVQKVPASTDFKRTILELKKNDQYSFQSLIDRLSDLGFEKKDFVEGYGDFAVRGGIIDVFPYVGDHPIRLEFWGDSVESIREFDLLSQRSIRELKSTALVPALERDAAETGNSMRATLFDHVTQGAVVILDEPALIESEISELVKEGAEDIFSYEEFVKLAGNFPAIIHSQFRHASAASLTLSNQPETPDAGPLLQPEAPDPIDFGSSLQPAFNGSIQRLIAELGNLSRQEYKIALACDTKSEATRLRELIEETLTAPDDGKSAEEIPAPGAGTGEMPPPAFTILPETVHSGFIYPSSKLAFFTEHEIFGRIKRRGPPKRRRYKGFSQKELHQLKRGDFVVHTDHGIGSFAGLSKIKVGGAEQEVMKLLFLENDVLYVNLNFINRVQKYSSQEGHIPPLSKLGGGDWERAKARAKRRIKDIARDLIGLYARRKHEKGYAFSPDTHWQKELEASFMYEDTADQARATLEVKTDMESSAPMDRLICGDVGFGKTEVAVRAAFKAVMDGKQVALLVPTTILALQHYNTFRDRLTRYTTRVENITRFKSVKDQKKILADLAKGAVDILIGTHRLLSADIAFKDLGLLIIDEEHRFGVAAKEKLRKVKATVDTLTLTATPIPRTLHFSLIGARDLSLIATPPRNRLPISTEIIAADSSGRQVHWAVIREAILGEIHRGGQVYFVHDRVNNIEAIADQVRAHVPEARLHIAHGQMAGHQLEKAMLDFLEKKYDVLVCTKIIESGLDIPNVNTIIVNRADRFGLAELYQLRGRVGRSNVQAYAFLLTPPLSILPRPTFRRLQAIEEFTELGAGFNLAMRDLEIRGAGNLLGGEQSGYIMEMGFEMYERIVREAVEEIKQEEFKDVFNKGSLPAAVGATETVVESDIEALIPDFYVEADSERLDIYRRLYRASEAEELRSMREELRDRFGEYPAEVENLFRLVELRLAASKAGYPKISVRGGLLTLTLPDASDERFYGKSGDAATKKDGDASAPFQRIMEEISRDKKKRAQLRQFGKELALEFPLQEAVDVNKRLEEARATLDRIVVMTTVLLS
jgi:transcription-repair coupling factor (superfamily II helicase)